MFFSPDEIHELSRAEVWSREVMESKYGLSGTDRPVYLFGAGLLGPFIVREIRGRYPWLFQRIAGFLDNNPELGGTLVEGFPVTAAADPAVIKRNPLVILSVGKGEVAEEMTRQCSGLGYQCVPYYRMAVENKPRFDAGELENDPQAREGLELWDDAESRETYRSAARLLANNSYDDMPVVHDDQYFPPFVPRDFYRSFVDGGSFVGDTLGDYLRRFGDDFDNFYAFEPDPGNCAKIRAVAGEDRRIEVFNLALADSRQRMRMEDILHPEYDASGGKALEIAADALDNVLRDKRVTMIKMDIEGNELAALRGAESIIADSKPALAICVYHHPRDLWEIPLWIKTICPEHRLYLRHHSMTTYETVCYAIPTR